MVKLKSNSKQTHIKLSTRLMETSAENRKENNMKKLNRKKKISLDCYLDFLLSRNDLNLTVDFIHQIINMHGFRHIRTVRKKEIVDALSKLDLMDPSRSTLRENISPGASLTVEDVIGDLNDLNWQECCSVKTVTSWKGRLFPSFGSDAAAQPPSLQCTNISGKPKQGRKRNKGKMINDYLGCDGVEMGNVGKRMVQRSQSDVVEGDEGSTISGISSGCC